jgi:thiol-disulfide isomerase/thioredoxin
MSASVTPAPDAILLITPECPHCPQLLESLSQLVKRGALGRLQIINLAQHPQAAQQYGSRSVPWFRIGDLDFTGVHSQEELRQWAAVAQTDAGIRHYLIQQLNDGQRLLVESKIRAHPQWLPLLISIIADIEAPMQARIGVGAVFESLAGNDLLLCAIPALGALTQHTDHRVRGDACYYLGMTRARDAVALLTACLHDSNADVQEIAHEALAMLPVH